MSSLQDLHTDFEYARQYWDKLDLDVDFDTAIKMFNNSEYADPNWYAKPVYSEEAWEQMVDLAKASNESLNETLYAGNINELRAYLEHHEFTSDDFADEEDMAEYLCDEVFDEDYHTCNPDISHACYVVACEYFDDIDESLSKDVKEAWDNPTDYANYFLDNDYDIDSIRATLQKDGHNDEDFLMSVLDIMDEIAYENFDESISLGGGMKLPYDDNYCIFAKSADKKVTILKINNKKEFQDAERRYGSFINVCSTVGAAKSYTRSFTGPAKEWPVEVLSEGALTEGSYSSDEFGDWISDFELIPYEGYYDDEDYQIGIYNAGPHKGKYFIWDNINGSVLDNTYYDTEEEARKDLSWYLEESLTEGALSNGSYSLYNGWVKVPDKDSIPDEYPELEPEYSEWVSRANTCSTIDDADNFLDDVYKLRQQGLLATGEYGKENLIFKELRNNGILQRLKDMKVKEQNKAMSLESLNENTKGDHLEADLKALFKRKGYDVESEEVQNTIDAAAEYIRSWWEEGETDYDAEQWFIDTKMNYPEDLEALPLKEDYEDMPYSYDGFLTDEDLEDVRDMIYDDLGINVEVDFDEAADVSTLVFEPDDKDPEILDELSDWCHDHLEAALNYNYIWTAMDSDSDAVRVEIKADIDESCGKKLNEAEETDTRAQELANYLGVDVDEVKNGYTDNLYEVGNEEYWVLTEDEAEEEAKAGVLNIVDDMGLQSFSLNFQDEIINNYVDEDFIMKALDDEIEYYRTQENDEETAEMLEEMGFEDAFNYFRDEFSKRDFTEWVKDHIDWDAVAEEVVRLDGPEHTLATYDGKEIQLDNYYAYRAN